MSVQPPPGFQPPPPPMVTNTGDSFVPMAPVTSSPAKKRSKWPFFVIAAVVATGAAVAAVFVLGGGDDALDTDSAAEVIDDISRRMEFPDESRFLQVADSCQIDIDVFDDAAPDGVDTGRGDGVQSVEQLGDDDDPVVFSCVRADDDDDEFFEGLLWGSAPDGDFGDYVDRSFDNATVDFVDDAASFRGGTIVIYCVEFDDPDTRGPPFCEADWIDGTVQIGVFSTSIDADEADEWLRAALADVVAEVQALDADDFPVES